jgi:SAM-dependent methyltransferase
MNWKLKAHCMAVLSRTPGGRYAYNKLQAALKLNRLAPEEGIRRGCEVIDLAAQAGQSVRGRTVLEIGTGWRPFLPLLLWLAGSKRVVTIDVNPWLSEAYALETCRAIGEHLPLIADLLHADLTDLRARYEQGLQGKRTLHELLAAAGIEYRYPGDAARTMLPGESVDIVSSSNVLEHIPPDALLDIHTESLRILRPNGIVIHRVNPGDHYANADRSITTANFLRYSEREWRWYGGTGLSYHNRLRCYQHVELLGKAGFTVVIDRVRLDPRALAAIRTGQVPVHPDFSRYLPEQLASDYLWLVGRKGPPQVPNGAPNDSAVSDPREGVPGGREG